MTTVPDLGEVARAAQHVVAATCSEDAVPVAELLGDLQVLAAGTATAPGHLTAGDVAECLIPAIELYGPNTVLCISSDIAERRCRACGCTDSLACDAGCSWVLEDVCSSCVGDVLGELLVGLLRVAGGVNAVRYIVGLEGDAAEARDEACRDDPDGLHHVGCGC